MSRCGIVILAAGASTRMGTPKQSLIFQGSTLLTRAVNTALASVCRPIVVVLGANAENLRAEVQQLPVNIVLNQSWSRGMGTSIRAGIAALDSKTIDAAMIFLCDQPLITTAALDQMVTAHFAAGKLITAAFYSNMHGTPAVFSSSLFSELMAMDDGHGGKAVLGRHAGQIFSVDLPEAKTDIDTKDDYRKLSENESQ